MELFEFNWQCQRCNACCTSLSSNVPVPVLLSDTGRIARYMEITQREFVDKYCDYRLIFDKESGADIPLLSLRLEGRTCTLFTNSGCAIHPVKPYYCKAAPFVSMLFTDHSLRDEFKKHCEGYGKGKRHTIAEIKKQLEEEKRLEYQDILEYHRVGYFFINELFKKESENDPGTF